MKRARRGSTGRRLGIPQEVQRDAPLKKDDLIVITGAGGFIAGALTRHFHEQGFTRIRAIDRKPLPDWSRVTVCSSPVKSRMRSVVSPAPV